MHVCADRCASPPIFQNIKARGPCLPFLPARRVSLSGPWLASPCVELLQGAWSCHVEPFSGLRQEFHPPSIGPRQGINCRRAIVWSDCLGQWSPSRCSANSPLPRHGPICTSAVALLEQFEGSQKKKRCRRPASSLRLQGARRFHHSLFTINLLPMFPLKMHLSRSPSCSAENWVSSRSNGCPISTSRRMRPAKRSRTLEAQWSLSSPMQAPCRLPSAG